GISLSVEHEFYSALLELDSVFGGHVRVSFSNFLPSIKPGANQTMVAFQDVVEVFHLPVFHCWRADSL
ncbi:hypothetical protein, partial [Corynebacterium pacaense]|uniref:hypothetical protein n=1 Tax=Corynebacterium pacaense TaxID=1816684 RepID=UPI001C4E0BD9